MKRAVKSYLLRALNVGAKLHRISAVPAITYHSIDESGSPISFRKEFFRSQLRWLSDRGYRTVTASEAAGLLSGASGCQQPTVALTFDDGFRSVLETALPLLAAHGFIATIFCNPQYIGGKSEWARAPGIPAMELCNWPQLKTLRQEGWEIGAHTLSHASLPALSDEKKREEIGDGRRILEEALGGEVTTFAYPYGEFDDRSIEIVREAGFSSAWTMRPCLNNPGADLLSLGRFNCDRIRSDSPETAALAISTYLHGRYRYYEALTARSLRVPRPSRGN